MLSFSNDTTPTTVATGGNNNNNANNNASSTPYSGRSPSSFGLQIVTENNNMSSRQQEADEMMDDALGEVMIQESSDMVRSTSTSSEQSNSVR